MRATLKGRVRWQVLDERGVPEVPRTESGHAIGPADGVEQPNLITDLGMDQIGTEDVLNATASPGLQMWRRYLAVGTGSAAPDPADTTLAAEVQRAASSGSFAPGSADYELDADNDVWRATLAVTRLVTMTADRNITEFGLSPNSSGDIGIRELLRDGGGNPVPVSLLEGKSMRLDHTLVIELPAPENGTWASIAVDKYDAGNNLVQSTPLDIIHGLRVSTINQANLTYLFEIWHPRLSIANAIRNITVPAVYQRVASPLTSTNLSTGLTAEAYTPGTWQRVKRGTVPSGSGNEPWYGFYLHGGASASTGGGLMVEFDWPSSYTKQDTDTLRVGIVSSWARG